MKQFLNGTGDNLMLLYKFRKLRLKDMELLDMLIAKTVQIDETMKDHHI